jgi:type I restriction-modification system DNA methylase subunit
MKGVDLGNPANNDCLIITDLRSCYGFHFLKQDGVAAIILPHGVLFRGGAEALIRTKLLKDGHIDTVIGLPPICSSPPALRCASWC